MVGTAGSAAAPLCSPSSAVSPCFWGWGSRSSQNTARALRGATTGGGVRLASSTAAPALRARGGCRCRCCPPRRGARCPERPAGGSVPSPRARAAAATAAPVMSGRFQLPKHGCESGAAFPPVFGWSGTSRDRRRLSRLPASADALGLAELSRHSRGSLPHAVTASTPLGFGASLEAGSPAGICPLLDVPKATRARGLHLLTPRKAPQHPRQFVAAICR